MDIPGRLLLVHRWNRFIDSVGALTGEVLLVLCQGCLYVFLEDAGPSVLPPSITILPVFIRSHPGLEASFPQCSIATAENRGGPLLRLVGGLQPGRRRGRGAKGREDGGSQALVVTRHVFGKRTFTGDDGEDAVFSVWGRFGDGRELRLRLTAAGLAVLKLNQGLNLILNQLNKIKKQDI